MFTFDGVHDCFVRIQEFQEYKGEKLANVVVQVLHP